MNSLSALTRVTADPAHRYTGCLRAVNARLRDPQPGTIGCSGVLCGP